MRRPVLILLGVLLSASVPAFAAAETARQENFGGPLPVFELHSGFWINLHHFLYQQARQRREASAGNTGTPPAPASPALSAAERTAWDAAVTYYAVNFADRDLTFNSELIALKDQLGSLENCRDLSGKTSKDCSAWLPAVLTQVLEGAAPVYRAHWWPQHDRDNRRWIARVAPLVQQNGVELAQRLAEIYQAKWPREKIRVDICANANGAGAYATLDPLRVTISSQDPRNQDRAALEVLFHEASHGLAEPLQTAIIRECRQRGKPIPRDLWHALIFYTTGEVVKTVLRLPSADKQPGSSAEGYVPFAVREGLYTRGWESYEHVLERFWQPYLDGKSDFDDAVVRMVSAL